MYFVIDLDSIKFAESIPFFPIVFLSQMRECFWDGFGRLGHSSIFSMEKRKEGHICQRKNMKKNICHFSICLLTCMSLCLTGCSMKTDTVSDVTTFDTKNISEASIASAGRTFDDSASSIQSVGNGETAEKELLNQTNASVYQKENIKLIRNAYLQFETQDLDVSLTDLEKVVAECNGYPENSEIFSGTNSYRTASYTVRIPSAKYDDFLKAMTGTNEIGQLIRKTENTENVGEQYYDSESRLNTAKIKLERLQELLKKADKMSDILMLEESIAEVESEIESYSGTLKRYDGLIDYATFQIQLNEVVTYTPTEERGFGTKIADAFRESIENLETNIQNFILFGVRHWVGNLLIIAAGVSCCLLIRKKRKKNEENMGEPAKKEPVDAVEDADEDCNLN